MSIHIDPSSRLINSQEKTLALTCPHCQVVAHITRSAVPRFEELQAYRPRRSASSTAAMRAMRRYSCASACACTRASRIELSPQFAEIERAREKFSFTYLPEEVELLFKEALVCFSSGAFNAFASMCRRTAQAVFADLGEAGQAPPLRRAQRRARARRAFRGNVRQAEERSSSAPRPTRVPTSPCSTAMRPASPSRS